MSTHEFDTNKYYLGKLCQRSHNFFGTGQSIRRRCDNKCVDCRTKTQPYLNQKPEVPEQLLTEIDQSKLYLGKLCPQNHNWNNSGLSLRYKRNGKNCGNCVECKKEYFAKTYTPHPIEPKRNNVIDDKYYLGDLCGRGCEYEQSGKSLRYLSGGGCVECNRALSSSVEKREYNFKWKQNHKEHISAYNRSYRGSQTGVRVQALAPVPEFDQRRYYLGRICKLGHDWEETGGSLRLRWSGRCWQCLKQWQISQRKPRRTKIRIVIASKYYLGSLCHKEHNYESTGKSLRYLSSDTCVACTEEYNAEYCEENKEQLRRQKRDYRLQNRERLLERSRQYYQNNQEECLRRSAEYRKSDRGRKVMRICGQRRRVRKAQNHIARYTLEQRQQHFERFNNCCAYCGRAENLEVDHFIAVTKSGPDCLGNIVPACCRCNKSKNNSDPKAWYQRQPFYSARRWKHILRVLGKTESDYHQLPLL
jgi:hypothetical protein